MSGDSLYSTTPQSQTPELNSRQIGLLLGSVFLIAACSLLYELLISSLSTYLLGSSVVHYSITIGLFLFFMGVGAWLAQSIKTQLLPALIAVEVGIGIAGGLSALLLLWVYAWTEHYYIAMVSIIAMISILVGMELPLLTRILEQTVGLRKGISEVLSADYVGALLASLAFPFILLPYLGHLNTALVTGMLNLLVALVLAWQFRRYLGPWRKSIWLAATTGLLLLPGLLMLSGRLDTWLQQALYQDTVVHSEQSRYQKLIVTRWGDDTRLYLDGNLQFSSVDEYRYHEVLVHPLFAHANRRQRVLLIGGGDGLALREVLRYDEVQEVTVVDIDPAVTRLVSSMPVLQQLNANAFSDKRVATVHADAWAWLQQGSDLYDIILIDLPDPSTETLARLYTEAFYRRIARRLAVGGIVSTQATSPWFARKAFWSIGTTMEQVFNQVRPMHTYVPSFGPWGFFIASQHDADALRHPLYKGRFVNASMLPALMQLPADQQRLDVDANRIGSLELLEYYREGWSFINEGKATP